MEGGDVASNVLSPTPPLDDFRCTRNNGKWRCSRQRLNGTNYCDKHHRKAKLKLDITPEDELRRKRNVGNAAKPYHDKVKLQIIPEDDLRCKRNVGNDLWCKNWRIHGKSLCQKHYLMSLSKSRVFPSTKREWKKGNENLNENRRKNEDSSMKRNRQESCINGQEEDSEEEIRKKKKRRGRKKKSVVPEKFYRPGKHLKVGTESEKKILNRERKADMVKVKCEVSEKEAEGENELVSASKSDSVARVNSGSGEDNNAHRVDIPSEWKMSLRARKPEVAEIKFNSKE
ncbi:hypothetical protein NE237_020956 [Protea cynaroides]|uniref:WRC domain-containing protein n=1 Tax=Protea cynaroides TaxID=273540 RepID=A0A9Q0H9G0_9MAGN|nr:hypothetical protein NE237_020956 [Protea cynaroides]